MARKRQCTPIESGSDDLAWPQESLRSVIGYQLTRASLSTLRVFFESVGEALALRPDDAEGWYSLAVALQELGQVREAVDPLRRVLRLRPHDASAVEQLASVCSYLGEDQAAAYLYRRAEVLARA